MSTMTPRQSIAAAKNLRGEPAAELHSGDRMTREEFHRLYEQAPENFKAELIGGIVYVASPVSRRHGRPHALLNHTLMLYEGRTPGVETFDNTTVFLGDDSEPQPDLALRIKPEYGGRSRNTSDGDYIAGPPELVVEVAYSSRAVDLHAKREDYAQHGVTEYVVWSAKEGALIWFDLANDSELVLPEDGIVRSLAFPGLWLDGPAVRADDVARLASTLEAGLASPEHATFVKRVAEAKR